MPDELKIGVSVPGAKAAEEDLRKVAAAERGVGQAAAESSAGQGQLAGQQKASAEAASELRMRNVSLLNQFRALGPEASVAADIFHTLTTRTTALGMGLGLAGAAIGAVTLVMQKLSQAQAEHKRRTEEMRQVLASAYDSYMSVAEAIDKMRAAGAPKGPPAAALTTEAAQLALAHGLSPEQMRKLAEQMAAGGLTGASAAALAKAMAPVTPPSPEVARQYGTDIRRVLGGMQPGADIEAILADVAARETAAGRARTPEQIRQYVVGMTEKAITGDYGRGPGEELGRVLAAYPELGQMQVVPGEGNRFTMPWQQRKPEWREAGPGEKGTPISTIIYQGGTHYHGTYEDPAGKAAPNPAAD